MPPLSAHSPALLAYPRRVNTKYDACQWDILSRFGVKLWNERVAPLNVHILSLSLVRTEPCGVCGLWKSVLDINK